MAGNNSGESSYYGRRDFPHGRAKHIALYRIMQSQIARVLRGLIFVSMTSHISMDSVVQVFSQ